MTSPTLYDERPLYTTAEECRKLGIAKATFNRWRTSGIVKPAFQVGATVRWYHDEVIRSLRTNGHLIANRPQPRLGRSGS